MNIKEKIIERIEKEVMPMFKQKDMLVIMTCTSLLMWAEFTFVVWV